ncbi:S8 family serine peptidase [Aquibacillus albus]|uniref:Minor extracellular serine protease Vpr n=1 Tax=Aquibacillus albus TaxID=1168171 RepID=A0ABS2MZI0_9BACI|nr:S8 family serine peptidase [Aquibacillus albus]MBM7571282.1 minor extracellular serine protease Vpr [Aquibacillus albus]
MKFRTHLLLIISILLTNPFFVTAEEEEQAIIIEVEGNPHTRKAHIEDYYPFIEVVQVYDQLFNGLALKGTSRKLERMDSLDFVKQTYPVRTYKTNTPGTAPENSQHATTQQPSDITVEDIDISVTLESEQPNVNKSIPFLKQQSSTLKSYTGKGIKIGVVDTGIDHHHPDLKNNFKGGYDLVDLDDDPMETIPEQGIPTLHGTHVSGIIAANGSMQGVAPEASLYSYRALGPGGMGTSIQVIAAIERAVKDGMDIINLSLGNSVNGPDWPTSVAVNRAVELGVTVVIANGNSGPSNWTVGSPATASNVISVGASTPPLEVPYLFDSFHEKRIALTPLMGSQPWQLEREYPMVQGGIGNQELPDADGKIVLMERGEIPFAEKARLAEQSGAKALIIYNNEDKAFQGSIEDGKEPIDIPVASVSMDDGQWLKEQATEDTYYIETKYKKSKDMIAAFSSRGPVTANWWIKPEIVAPGAAINSTVPGGYRELQGTSMAAPHVAGGLALVKQAHPDWSPAKLKGALLTSALPLKNEQLLYDPIEQGMGRMQIDKAIHTPLVIYNPLLSFGKVTDLSETHMVELELENVTTKEQDYYFDIPKQQSGLRWQLPKQFTLDPGEKKTVPIQLKVSASFLDKGIHQGWLTLKQGKQSYHLPYLFINQEADYPRVMGMEFALKVFSDDEYQYRLYLPEDAQSVTIDLYDSHSMAFERTLLELENQKQGVIEGTMEMRDVGDKGEYLANVSVKTTSGETYDYQTDLYIE